MADRERLGKEVSAELDITASFSLRLGDTVVSLDRLRAVIASVPGTDVSTELGISINYGPTRDWRSVNPTLAQTLSRLLKEKGAIGYADVEASLFTASPINTTWVFSPEIISLLAQLRAGVSVRILHTSNTPEEANKPVPAQRP